MISQKDTIEAFTSAYDNYREKDEFTIDNNEVEYGHSASVTNVESVFYTIVNEHDNQNFISLTLDFVDLVKQLSLRRGSKIIIDGYRINFDIIISSEREEPFYSYDGMVKTLNNGFKKMAELREGISAEIIKAMSLRALDAHELGISYYVYETKEEKSIGHIIVSDNLSSSRQPRELSHSLVLKRESGIGLNQMERDIVMITETIRNEHFNWKTPVSPELLDKYSSILNEFDDFYYIKS